jgi:large subunit ribosomal protein L23
MSFLGIGKNDKKEVKKPTKAKAEKKAVATKTGATSSVNLKHVIIRPHITEKSGLLSQDNVYSFEVTENSTKGDIANAVAFLYKVTPVKVSVARMMPRRRTLKGRPGFSAKGKKAYVRIKEGDKIEFI